ncbi:MAG TPA: hypothetical protein VKV57_09000 [bacterium]|nr:hypothetical protein [bacterium]
MAEGLWPISKTRVVPGWGASISAGAIAGVVAALASVGVEVIMHARVPPRDATLWSAFLAGILGGILYGWLGRIVRRPVEALWVITLAIATISTVLIAKLPGASGPSPSLGIPLSGFTSPFRQLLALAGLGHFGTRHFPARYLPADAATHYITAVSVALLVPWWANTRGR